MAPAAVTPARALARLMIASLTTVLLTLIVTIGAVGVGDAEPSGAAPTLPAQGAP